MKQLNIQKYEFPIHALIRRIKQEKVIINEFVGKWSNEQKSQLIEDILLNIPTRHIFATLQLRGTETIVVGNEEVAAIQQFMKNEFALSGVCEEINGKKFSELTAPLQAWIEDTKIQIYLIPPSVSDSMIERIIQNN